MFQPQARDRHSEEQSQFVGVLNRIAKSHFSICNLASMIQPVDAWLTKHESHFSGIVKKEDLVLAAFTCCVRAAPFLVKAEHFFHADPAEVLSYSRLLSAANSGVANKTDPNLYAHRSSTVSSAEDYSLRFITTTDTYRLYGFLHDERGGTTAKLFTDAPLGLAICFEDLPCAAAFCLPADSSGTLVINQIQATTYIDPSSQEETSHQPHLRGFSWRNLLVDNLVKYADAAGFKRVGIQSAENNQWANEPDKLSKDRAFEIYDKTAKACGFTIDPTSGNYFRDLK